MLEIGKKLKEERIRQGYSLEEMSQKTRFSISQLDALENGNLDYFKDDITYVKFFIQYYCKALNVSYGEFRDDLDQSMITYTNMLSEKEVEELRRQNEQIQKKLKQNKARKRNRRSLKKLDFSMLSMLMIATVMLIALGFILGNYIIPSLMNPHEKIEVPRVSDTTPIDTTTTPDEVENGKEEACQVLFNMVNKFEYEVRNVNDCEQVNVEIKFQERTWIEVSKNRTLDANIKSKVYKAGESVKTTVTNGDELKINLGYLKGNQFFINEQEVNLDASIASSTGGNVIYFRVKGE